MWWLASMLTFCCRLRAVSSVWAVSAEGLTTSSLQLGYRAVFRHLTRLPCLHTGSHSESWLHLLSIGGQKT